LPEFRKFAKPNQYMNIYRQRQTNATVTPFALAQRYLPRELLQDLRMARPVKLRRFHQLETVEEEDDDEG